MTETFYVLIRADGSEDMKQVKESALSLEFMQRLVGGHVETVTLVNWVMVVDEDGRHKNLPLNVRASAIAAQPIVGPAVFVPRNVGWG